MSVPRRSAGSRSGVNWILENPVSRHPASELMASVLASPGTPSRMMWPPLRSPMMSWSTS